MTMFHSFNNCLRRFTFVAVDLAAETMAPRIYFSSVYVHVGFHFSAFFLERIVAHMGFHREYSLAGLAKLGVVQAVF